MIYYFIIEMWITWKFRLCSASSSTLSVSTEDDFLHCESLVKNWATSSLTDGVEGDKHTLRDLLFFLHVPRTGGRTYFHWQVPLLDLEFELILFSFLFFLVFFSPVVIDVHSSGSFLRKLYTSDQECPRSYDKLRFDPRWVYPLHGFQFLVVKM